MIINLTIDPIIFQLLNVYFTGVGVAIVGQILIAFIIKQKFTLQNLYISLLSWASVFIFLATVLAVIIINIVKTTHLYKNRNKIIQYLNTANSDTVLLDFSKKQK